MNISFDDPKLFGGACMVVPIFLYILFNNVYSLLFSFKGGVDRGPSNGDT